LKHYIVGYGSLFNEKSLQRTLPSVNYIEPIYLNNYLRSWNAVENKTVTLSTTYLGIEKAQGHKLNAILFEIDESLLDNLDKREFLYGREEVELKDIELISNKGLDIYWCGLNQDSRGKPFMFRDKKEHIGYLMAISDELYVLSAVCTICGEKATKTFRKISSSSLIEIGGEDKYEARCKNHWQPK